VFGGFWRRLGRSAFLTLRLYVALFAIVSLPIHGIGQTPNKVSEAILISISERGSLLAAYDRAAWQATDAVKAAHPGKDLVGRYIARKTHTGWTVDFGYLNQAQDKFLVAHEAIQGGGSTKFTVKSFDPALEDTGWNLAAAKGIAVAMRDFDEPSRPYNIAVLPAEREGMYVYLYPAQVVAGVYPLGADARYRVSRDGMRILEKRQMHKSIIESVPAGKDVNVAVGYHSHVLSDLPEDTDVMLVLTRRPRVPEIVVAGAYTFTIDVDGKITVEDRPKP
jgi:hypothetical protein